LDTTGDTPKSGLTHDANGKFARGNPGRPRGSRNRLTNQLALALLDDFSLFEADNIERLRRHYFEDYVRLMARFLPRVVEAPRIDFSGYGPAETAAVATEVRLALEAVERGEAGLDAVLAALEREPAMAAPPLQDISNDVKYVEST
jgi:hypothetical protein